CRKCNKPPADELQPAEIRASAVAGLVHTGNLPIQAPEPILCATPSAGPPLSLAPRSPGGARESLAREKNSRGGMGDVVSAWLDIPCARRGDRSARPHAHGRNGGSAKTGRQPHRRPGARYCWL